AGWQTPGALATERKRKELPQRELVFFAIRSDANSNGILRDFTTQSSVDFVPPAKDRSPVRIGLSLHDGMMNAVHTGSMDDEVQNTFELNLQSRDGMTKWRWRLEGE